MTHSENLPLWLIKFSVPREDGLSYAEGLEEVGEALSWDEEEKMGFWTFYLYGRGEDNQHFSQEVTARLSIVSTLIHQEPPSFSIEEIPETNWILETYAAFPPLSIGSYYIHGSHIVPSPQDQAEKVCLQIDAATAFGSGKHATTHGCVEALIFLKEKGFSPKQCLDVGCGSGILAMVIATAWPESSVTAVDNDPIAVQVTQENAILNQVRLDSFLSDGVKASSLQEKAPYDLIAANILANPLCEMAFDFSSVMIKGGYVVLSGFLEEQESQVQEAYEKAGCEKIHAIHREGWVTLLMKKSQQYGQIKEAS